MLFVLPKANGQGIHGVVGIHVDDGLGAGDQMFEAAISKLEQKYPFGSKKETELIFTGIHVVQQWDGSIDLDQTQYVEDIPSIDISRERRLSPETPVTEAERQALRGLVGSIQYAATIPVLIFQQSSVCYKPRSTAQQFKNFMKPTAFNRSQKSQEYKVTLQSIPIHDLRFVSFSDASFANRAMLNRKRLPDLGSIKADW